jgi:hypothetical protein
MHPNSAEIAFLKISYNRFIDLYQEINASSFWQLDDIYRFSRLKEIFFVYNEIIKYKPLQHILKNIEEHEIGQIHLQSQFFKFLRNLFAHFSFFNTYDEVWITKQISNWDNRKGFIYKFLNKYVAHEPIKYRVWNKKSKNMSYLSIQFPINKDETTKIYLREFTTEKEGVIFSIDCMWRLLSSQIESFK